MNLFIGNFIKELLNENNLTEDDLAAKLNMTKADVVDSLSGNVTFNIHNLVTIADIFNVSLDQMCGRNLILNQEKQILSNFEKTAKSNSIKELEELISAGANIFGTDVFSKDLMYYAIKYRSLNIIKYLIDKANTTEKWLKNQSINFLINEDEIEQIRCFFLMENNIEYLNKLFTLTNKRKVLIKDKDGYYSYDDASKYDVSNLSEINCILKYDVKLETLIYLIKEESNRFKYDKLLEEAVKKENDHSIIKCIDAVYTVNPQEEISNPYLYQYIFRNNKKNILSLLINKSNKIKQLFLSINV